jgi:hypothetical protein
MFLQIFLFELYYRLRRPTTWIYFALLMIVIFLTVAIDGVTFGANNIYKNAPCPIALALVVGSALGMLISSAMFSPTVQRDYETGIYPLYFTTPISKFAYLGGRFAGTFVVTALIFTGLPSGIYLGSIICPPLGWVDAARIGPNHFINYFQPYVMFVLPNIFIAGAIFFTVATLSRKMLFAYLANVILLVAYLIALTQLSNLDHIKTYALLDPFGLMANMDVERYWTTSEQNTMLVPFIGSILYNRVIWTAIGGFIFALCYALFKFETPAGTGKKQKAEKESLSHSDLSKLPKTVTTYTTAGQIGLMLNGAWINFVNTVRELPFIGIVLGGVAFMIFASTNLQAIYDTKIYPVTYALLELTRGSFGLFFLIIITFYSGELVWNERELKLDQMYDTLPVPNWLSFWSKALTLFLINVLLVTVIMVVSILIQLAHAYTHLELLLYIKTLYFIVLPGYLLISIFALFIQTIINNKFAGHFVMVAYYVIFFRILPVAGFEHGLYRLFDIPGGRYSDMNGFGAYIPRLAWYMLYWGAAALILAVFAQLLWPRGTDENLSSRFALLKQNLNGRIATLLLCLTAVFVGTGGWIYYNQDILNKYSTTKGDEKMQADYEKQYRKFLTQPDPKVAGILVKIDLVPEELRYSAVTQITLQNRSVRALDSVFITYPTALTTGDFDNLGKVIYDDKKVGFRIYKLAKALQPYDSITVTWRSSLVEKGFKNGAFNNTISYNGSFVHSDEFVPYFGYNPDNELEAKDKRRKQGMGEQIKPADPETNIGRERSQYFSDADWISYDCVVSTSPSQIAISPGYLQKEWTENGRRYFHYKMDAPILNFYSVLSAEYEVARDTFHGINLEIYYHKGHGYNLKSMMRGMKDALKYAGENFSPYQFRQARIIEFPRYESFAQSFANTVPFSESIGFMADLRDSSEIDYPYYVTAHEIGHQWWAHQVSGSRQKGSLIMTESMAQYTALMVMKHTFGADKMRKFLKYEMDRYLAGRQLDPNGENPLYHVLNQQHIYYQKGSCVMYAMQDYIGEDNFNKAMSAFIKANQFQRAPYANSVDYLDTLSHYTPDSLKYLITDMYKTITLYSNKCDSASWVKTADGKYKVTIHVTAEKFRADSAGKETAIPFADYIDIGVLGPETNGKYSDKQLFLKKFLVKPGKNTFEVIVGEEPVKAGIDIYNKLIDRDTDDNVKAVTKAG